jgi:hypothetical protein
MADPRPFAPRPGDPRADLLRQGFAEVFGGCPIPVPVEAIAEDYLGLSLRVAHMPVSGLLLVSQRQLWTHGDEPPERRRFTIAHEIAHWVCHRHGVPSRCDLDAGAAARDPREREANTFAAELLMPADAVRAAHGHGLDAEELAHRFAVSGLAMAWRLYNLALGPPPPAVGGEGAAPT